MKTAELDFTLPESSIAQFPAHPRDHSRLLTFWRGSGRLRHGHFHELPELLNSRDLLLANDSRVLPAKLTLARPTGRKFQGLFMEELSLGNWRMMLRSNGQLAVNEQLILTGGNSELTWHMRLLRRCNDGLGQWLVQISPAQDAQTVLKHAGEVPLPPYIQKARDRRAAPLPTGLDDRISYQTVYSHPLGALAAPTAGLHFTPELLGKLAASGARQAFLTLDVGLGTFLPIRTENLCDHPMHHERFHIPSATVEAIRQHRQRAGRLVLVGTTTVRSLESAASTILDNRVSAKDITGSTDLFIEPGFSFQLTDALITNFHLPKSTLLALVAALIGLAKLKELYTLALREGYRFYSYGDAMLILP